MKQMLRDAAVAALRGGLAVAGARGRRIVADALTRDQDVSVTIEQVETPRGSISFYCAGDVPRWRAQTLLTKEPETIEWIDTFGAGDVFWDVGANVGVYTLYAAIKRDVRVLSFEPGAANYFLLNRNIEINGLSDAVQAFCLALADRDGLDMLNMQSTGFGGAESSFGVLVDHNGEQFVPAFRQGMVGYSIDGFVGAFKPAFPNHLKIDVDGIEDRIVAGAATTLADKRLRSLSIELDADRKDSSDAIVSRLSDAGLKLVSKRHASIFDGGAYQNIFNYLFRRQ